MKKVKPSKEPMENSSIGNAIIPAADVLIHDPESIDTLREGSKNTLFITWPVWLQLNVLKSRPEIGIDAKECIDRIEDLRKKNDPSLIIWKKTSSFSGLRFLDKKDFSHQVIAAAISIKETFKSTNRFQGFKFLCRDSFSRTTAREIDGNGLIVENYHHDRVEVETNRKLREVIVSEDDFYTDEYLIYRPEVFGDLDENEGIICHHENGDGLVKTFSAIKKEFYLQIIPANISAFGIKPLPLFDKSINWSQYIAFQQLLDPDIRLVFLEGSAGTGKTLIALACALAQKNLYTQIALTRPMVQLEDEDKMGFLPGKVEDKMGPWIRPLWMALQFLVENQKIEVTPKPEPTAKPEPHKKQDLEPETNLDESMPVSMNKMLRAKRKTKKEERDKRRERREKREEGKKHGFINRSATTVEELRFKHNIIIEPLSYIRGMTLYGRTFLILDESQNTTPHTIKTIITRAGEGSKIVLTGDLSQVDIKSIRKSLDKNSCGLAHAMAKMKHKLVATTRFENNDSVRSLLAKLATERL